jgi:hypothetical protein
MGSTTVQIPNLSVQRKDDKTQTQFSFPEGIFYSNQLRRQIATMKDQNRLLLLSGPINFKQYPARTAETFIYEAKGKAFGDKVEVPFTNPETGKEQLLVRYIHKKYRNDEVNLMLILRQGFRGKQEAEYFANKKNQKITDINELNETDVLILRGGVIEARNVERTAGENFSYGGRDDLNLYTSDGALIGSFVRHGYFGSRRYVFADIGPSDRLWVPNSNADAKVEKLPNRR